VCDEPLATTSLCDVSLMPVCDVTDDVAGVVSGIGRDVIVGDVTLWLNVVVASPASVNR